MKSLEEVRSYFEADRFAMEQGIRIDSVGEGWVVCSVELEERHRNALGGVQGGMMFTLADFAFAVAVNCDGAPTVTLNSTIHYLRPAKGRRLIATTACESRGKSICVYTVNVCDEYGSQIAIVTSTGVIRSAPPEKNGGELRSEG